MNVSDLNMDGTELESWRKMARQWDTRKLVHWALERFKSSITFASSFGAEDVVLIDLFSELGAFPEIFLLDTGRLHQETYDTVERIRQTYGISIKSYFPDSHDLEPFLTEFGPNAFYESVDLRRRCCDIRKLFPLKKALAGKRAWITGLRKEQAVSRANVEKLEWDEKNGGLIKINPLVEWGTEDIWNYIKAHNIPYNPLHDRGYPSIGCAPCTRAADPGDNRSGRWWWESSEHRECGLHPGRAQ